MAHDVLSFIIVSWTPEVCICVSLCKVDNPNNYGGVVPGVVAAKLTGNILRASPKQQKAFPRFSAAPLLLKEPKYARKYF